MNNTDSAGRFAKAAVSFSLILSMLLVMAACGYVYTRPDLLSMLCRNAAFEGKYSEAEIFLNKLEEIDRGRFYQELLAVASIADYHSDWDIASALLENQLQNGGDDEAYTAFSANAEEMLKQCEYHQALQLYQQKEYSKAARMAAAISGYDPAESLYQLSYQAYVNSQPTPEPTPVPTQTPAPALQTTSPAETPASVATTQVREVGQYHVAAGYHHTVFLRPDGTVLAYGDNSYGQTEVSQWRDVVAVAAGAYHTIGLTRDGHVLAAGDNTHGQTDVALYSDVQQIAAGSWNTCLLLKTGQVITLGFQPYEYAAELPSADAVFAGSYGMIVRSGGTNHASHPGIALGDACVASSISRGYAIGINADGMVHAAGIQLPEWKDAIQVSAGENAALALTRNGQVLSKVFGTHVRCTFDFGQPVLALCAGANHYAFILEDGTTEIRYADGTVFRPEETLW